MADREHDESVPKAISPTVVVTDWPHVRLHVTPGSFFQGPDTDQDAVARNRAALREGRSASEELLNYSKAGAANWITLNLTPVLDANGVLERYIAVQTDISERKR